MQISDLIYFVFVEEEGVSSWLKAEAADGFSKNDVDRANELVDLMDPRVTDRLRNPGVPTLQKLLLASKLSGLKWESQFWEIARATITPAPGQSLDSRFDLLCDNDSYFNLQSERLSVHESRCPGFEPHLKKHLLSRMICMGTTDKAVKVRN